LAYADDVNFLGGNIHNINKNSQTLIDATKEDGSGSECSENYVYLGISSPECRPKSRYKNSKLVI
jgi:hypothetical protein